MLSYNYIATLIHQCKPNSFKIDIKKLPLQLNTHRKAARSPTAVRSQGVQISYFSDLFVSFCSLSSQQLQYFCVTFFILNYYFVQGIQKTKLHRWEGLKS